MLDVDCRSIWIRDMDATEERERGRYAQCIGNVAVEENGKNHMGDEKNKMRVYCKKLELKESY